MFKLYLLVSNIFLFCISLNLLYSLKYRLPYLGLFTSDVGLTELMHSFLSYAQFIIILVGLYAPPQLHFKMFLNQRETALYIRLYDIDMQTTTISMYEQTPICICVGT